MTTSAGTLVFEDERLLEDTGVDGASLEERPLSTVEQGVCLLGEGIVAATRRVLTLDTVGKSVSPLSWNREPEIDFVAKIKTQIVRDPSIGLRIIPYAVRERLISQEEAARLVSPWLRATDNKLRQLAFNVASMAADPLYILKYGLPLYRSMGGSDTLAYLASIMESSAHSPLMAYRYLAEEDVPESESFVGVVSEDRRLSDNDRGSLLSQFSESSHKYVRLAVVEAVAGDDISFSTELLTKLSQDEDSTVAEQAEEALL